MTGLPTKLTKAQQKQTQEFLDLLELCRIQVEGEAECLEPVAPDAHLYPLLWSIYLRLCGGNIDQCAVGAEYGPETR